MKDEKTGENQFLKNYNLNFSKLSHVDSGSKLQIIKFKNQYALMDEQQQEMLNQDKVNYVNQLVELSRIKKSIQLCDDKNDSKSGRSSTHKQKNKKTNQQSVFFKRFLQYKKQLSQSINQLESVFEGKLDGLLKTKLDLKKQSLTQQQLLMYHAKILPTDNYIPQTVQKHKNIIQKNNGLKLPKLRSLSEKNLIPQNILSRKHNNNINTSNLNKWYIDPKIRFSMEKQKIIYNWKTQQGMKNLIGGKDIKISRKQIHNLISQVKQKFNRQPLFCNYVKFT